MALEIERRFLIDPQKLPKLPQRRTLSINQGYLSTGVRIRIATVLHEGCERYPQGYITIKKTIAHGTNTEFEYSIPVSDAEQLIEMCEFTIAKTRYEYPVGSHIFEIDVFVDDLNGLVIGEVELSSIDEPVDIPSWFGPEVTGNRDYSNNSLAAMPDKNEILDVVRARLEA